MTNDIVMLMLRRIYYDLGQVHGLKRMPPMTIPSYDNFPIIVDEYTRGHESGLEMTVQNHECLLPSQLRT